ncbi:hypothetical protein AC1031_002341 [Aphanomyces cochlioides]|nr:hypothetical protein AC1031_002341 [Aphanomyces cochlioides]
MPTWTHDCVAQKTLDKLFDEGTVDITSKPRQIYNSAPEVFKKFAYPTFTMHVNETKKRLKTSIVEDVDEEPLPFIGSKRKSINGISSQQSTPSESSLVITKPEFLMAEYFDFDNNKKHVAIVVNAPHGVKHGKFEVSRDDLTLGTLTWEWSHNTSNIKELFKKELESPTQTIWNKVSALQAVLLDHKERYGATPTTKYMIRLPCPVVATSNCVKKVDLGDTSSVFVLDLTMESDKENSDLLCSF